MKVILLIFQLLLMGAVQAQENIKPKGKWSYGSIVIEFRSNQRYLLTNYSESRAKTRGTWRMEGERLILTDLKTNQQYLVLEYQKGDWYERNEMNIYTFKSRFSKHEKRPKIKPGQGC
jgi:hypothetical protein